MTREEKKRDKARRAEQRRHRLCERCERALGALGLGDWYRGLTPWLKTHLAARCSPPPQIDTERLGPLADQVRAGVLRDLDEAEVDVGDACLPWSEADSVLYPLAATLKSTRVDLTSPADPDARRFREVRGVCAQRAGEVGLCSDGVLADVLLRAAAEVSGFDLRLVWFRATRDCNGYRRWLRVTFEVEPPQRAVAVLDGAARPVYRCGGPRPGGVFVWVAWPAEVLGVPGEYPVYVQPHALRRLRERLDPMSDACVHHWLVESLADPVVARRPREDTYLVEYRIGPHRVGYLVARRLPGLVVLTTFLFLTMQGTPEAERLAGRLRLRRPDIEYAGLDTLSAFLNSDLALDPDLAPALDECGCAGLLDFTYDELPASPVRAARLRAYLGMAPRPNPAPVDRPG